MKSYWLEGNNQTFIYLMEMTKRAEYLRERYNNSDATDDALEEADAYFGAANDFFTSVKGNKTEQVVVVGCVDQIVD